MAYDITTDYLDTDDANRLHRHHPELAGVGPHTYCPTCDKTGTYRWRGTETVCDCVRQLQLFKHYANSGIGSTYQRIDWDDWQGDPDAAAVMRHYADTDEFIRRGVGVFLFGGIGTGKTMLAMLALKEMVKRGIRCYATTFANMVDSFTSTWGDTDERRWFERKFRFSKVLLLDDLGREFRRKNALAETTFDNLLRTRVQEGRPTLITTNLLPGEVSRGYGSGVLSLLHERSIAMEFAGDDFRPTVGSRNIDEVLTGEMRPIA